MPRATAAHQPKAKRIMVHLKGKSVRVACVVAALALLGSQAGAAPMRCSGEQKICQTECSKTAKGAAVSVCFTTCGQRQAMCVKTGCWDNSGQKYCGLLRE